MSILLYHRSFAVMALLVVILGLLSLATDTVPAQTPSPVPAIAVPTPVGPAVTPPTSAAGTFIGPSQINPPGQPICSTQGAISGGQSVATLNLRIRLPALGTYNVNFGIADPGGEFMRVCYVEGDAVVFFGRDGRETSRRLTPMSNPATVNPVLDQVARGVSLTSPAPTPRPLCATGGQPGNQRVGAINGISVVLPAGDYVMFISPPGSPDPTFGVCYVQGNARVTISGTTCAEVSRHASDPDANAVLDAIVSSCTLPPRTPPSSPVGNQPERAPIRPPDTGDAGLL